MSDVSDKTLEPIDEEAFLKSWDALAPTMDGIFSALSGVMGAIKRGVRALAIGIAVALLASHQPYISTSPAGLAVAAGLLSFINLTKTIAIAIVIATAALALTPAGAANWISTLMGKLL